MNSVWSETNFPKINISIKPCLNWMYKEQEDTNSVNLYSKIITREKNKSISKITLVVLHGLFANGSLFLDFAENLLQENEKVSRVILIDSRNHGLSDHNDSMTYEEMAADVFRHLEMLGVGNYLLVAHSMGAKTAMVMSMQNNKGMIGLVIVDTFPLDYKDTPEIYSKIEKMIQFLDTIDLEKFKSKTEVIDFISEQFVNRIFLIFLFY
jgi:pimeloyl-ACP methyl ester carboxylesterase